MTGSLPKVNRFFPSVGSVLTASLVKSTDYFSSNSIDKYTQTHKHANTTDYSNLHNNFVN